MMWEYVLLVIIGLSAGIVVAAGLFAFIVAIGVINKAASNLGVAKYIDLYEYMIIFGVIIFNIIYLFGDGIIGGHIGLAIMGIFFGIFVGMQAMAIAEVTKVTPILFRKTKLASGLPYIIIAITIGKAIGSLFGLCYK